MSAITDYFTAPSDEVAATALDGLLDLDPDVVDAAQALYRTDPDEASRPRVQSASSGTPVLQAKRIEPGIALSRLEAALTGRTYEQVTAGPRRGSLVAAGEDGDAFVLTVADELRDALAGLDSDAVAAAARVWIFDEAADPTEASARSSPRWPNWPRGRSPAATASTATWSSSAGPPAGSSPRPRGRVLYSVCIGIRPRPRTRSTNDPSGVHERTAGG